MISEWAYYLMSPFNLIYLFVPLMQLPAAILIVTVLKFGTAGLSMAYLLKSLKLQKIIMFHYSQLIMLFRAGLLLMI